MVSSNRKAVTSKNPIDASGSTKLIDTAQRLYGIHGLEGVSLRQIIRAAGAGNKSAVQYHFGSASGLISEILKRGIPQIELLRAQRLAEVEKAGRQSDVRALMDILYRPLVDHLDSQGDRSYARFVLALYQSPAHPQFQREALSLMPIGARVSDLVRAANSHIPPALMGERFRLIAIMFLTSIFNRHPPFEGPDLDEALIDNVLDMATAALLAPVPDPILKAVNRDGGVTGSS